MMKKIRKLKPKIYLLITLVYLVVSLLSTLLLYEVTPGRYFAVYPAINVFYWVCGMAMTFFLDRVRSCGELDRLLNTFMLFRAVKLMLIIVVLIVGIMALDLSRTKFPLSLMCNYIIYSAMELYIYYRFNKNMIENK